MGTIAATGICTTAPATTPAPETPTCTVVCALADGTVAPSVLAVAMSTATTFACAHTRVAFGDKVTTPLTDGARLREGVNGSARPWWSPLGVL